MANGMENAPDYIIPALPLFPGVAPLVHDPGAGDGQIWLLGSPGTAVAAATTLQPTQHILMPAGSAIWSLTSPTTTTTSSSGGADEADGTPQKGNVCKQKLPDFSCAFSQDNTLLSGN
jgi:hypothetical protein